MFDFWQADDPRPIHLKEADALLRALQASKDVTKDTRVIAHVDNRVVVDAWNNFRSRKEDLNILLLQLFQYTVDQNCDLNIVYINTKDNRADAPSRTTLDNQHTSLSAELWEKVERLFGPHNFDLMSLDSNVPYSLQYQELLPHYTPCRSPNSSGVDFFAQALPANRNFYIYPPAALVRPAYTFLKEECTHPLAVTMIVEKPDCEPHWWKPLMSEGKPVRIATRGSRGQITLTVDPHRLLTLNNDLYAIRFSW